MSSTLGNFLYYFFDYFLLSNVYFLSLCKPYYLGVPWIIPTMATPLFLIIHLVANMFYFLVVSSRLQHPKLLLFKRKKMLHGTFNFLELLLWSPFFFTANANSSLMGLVSYVSEYINYSFFEVFFAFSIASDPSELLMCYLFVGFYLSC